MSHVRFFQRQFFFPFNLSCVGTRLFLQLLNKNRKKKTEKGTTLVISNLQASE